MHKKNIYHRHLINNDYICIQRILCIPFKMNTLRLSAILIRHTVQFQKPMYCLCFITCSFCHSLGCASCGCCQTKSCAFALKKTNNCIDRSSFTGTWSSCKDKKTISSSLYNSLLLHFLQNSTCFFLNLGNSSLHHLLILRITDIQFSKHSCCIQLQAVILAWINQYLSVILF